MNLQPIDPFVENKNSIYKVKIKFIRIKSIFWFSLLFYLSLLGVFFVFTLLLWILGSITGAVGNLENLITQLFGISSFHFFVIKLIAILFLIGLFWVFFATTVTVVFAWLYNLISNKIGGIEVGLEKRFHKGL